MCDPRCIPHQIIVGTTLLCIVQHMDAVAVSNVELLQIIVLQAHKQF